MELNIENLFNSGIEINMIRRHRDNTRHDIYRGALEKFLKNNPSLSLEWVASQMGVRSCTLYNWLEGAGLPTILQEENLLKVCDFVEEGLIEKIQFLTKKGGSNV